jgi:RND family efflux transporter MFP subunit
MTFPIRAVGVAPLAAVAALAVACGSRHNTFAPPPPPQVTVAHPVQQDVVRYLQYSTTLEAEEEVEIRARVAGFLDRVAFQPGGRVGKSDLLFVIDQRNYAAAVGRAEARLASAKAAARAADSDAKIAEDLARQRAGSEIDRIVKVAEAESAHAAIAVAEAELTTARLDLEFCEIRSPIAGRITKTYVDAGNLVGQGAPTALARVVTTKPVRAVLQIGEADLLELRRARIARNEGTEPGQRAPGEWWPLEATLSDREEWSIKGHVSSVDPLLDRTTGTLKVHCSFPNDDELMLPGLFVRVRFPLATNAAVVVPDIALLTDQGGRFALVVDANDEVAVRRVEIGDLDGTLRVVRAGLSTADRIVVNGLQRARPGAKVQPVMQER